MIDAQLFPPTDRYKYPHMFPQDVSVWEKFLEDYGEEYEGFYYDLQCGAPCMMYPHWEENYRKDAQVLSRLRTDAVGVKQEGYDVIEVKPRLNATAIGQVLTYKEHFIKDYEITKPVRAVIVVDQSDPNIMEIARKNDIIVYVMAESPLPYSS